MPQPLTMNQVVWLLTKSDKDNPDRNSDHALRCAHRQTRAYQRWLELPEWERDEQSAAEIKRCRLAREDRQRLKGKDQWWKR